MTIIALSESDRSGINHNFWGETLPHFKGFGIAIAIRQHSHKLREQILFWNLGKKDTSLSELT
ncbi:hypothetical protein JYQ62_31755 [Nostoc sp. UHCC 0702]|nr:hypothetical protein JYQ62_31755 [Nostoc sp. UHCC 0702]